MNPLGFVTTNFHKWYLIKFAESIRRQQNIYLPYRLGLQDSDVFKDIFFNRIYAVGFPFYKDSTIIDIGAHKGYFSLFAAKYAGSNSRIFAIEPEPVNYNILVKNINCNRCSSISPQQCAISTTTGKQKLYLSESVNHSLIKASEKHPYVKQDGSIDVVTFTLQDFLHCNSLSQVDFLKIDCEGGEYDILFNTDDETFSKISTLALEFHDISDQKKNIYTLSNYLFSKGFKHLMTHFQTTQWPLNMGTFIVSKN
jgi:FkbM family methyltransferase